MKHITKFLAAGWVLLALASCSHVAKYTAQDFVAVGQSSYTVAENVGSFQIPVTAYPINGTSSTEVTFEVIGGSAVAGKDFTVSPANGVLTFNGEKTQNITINVVDEAGVFTGDKKFSIKLASCTNGYTRSNYYTAAVTIKDLDHPLSALFGEYTMKCVSNSSSGYGYYSWAMNITPYEGDVTRIWMDVVAPFFSSDFYGSYAPHAEVYAIVSDNMKTITIPCPQEVESTAANAFGVNEPFAIYKFDGSSLDDPFVLDDSAIVFKLQEDGSYVTEDSYGFATESYNYEWFYYYMNALSGFNSKYPTVFKKN